MMAGYTGSKKFELAERILDRVDPDQRLEPDQIEKLYYLQRKRAADQRYALNDPTSHATMCSGVLHDLRTRR